VPGDGRAGADTVPVLRRDTLARMPTRWLIFGALVTGLAILVAGAVFFLNL
jgi:hypothetical protein